MSFFVISVADGLSAAAHRRAVRAGPSSVASRHDVPELLRRAGLCDIATTDVTAEYHGTARAWLAARERRRVELETLNRDRLRQQQRDMAVSVAAIEDGLLLRSLVTARRPSNTAPLPRPRREALASQPGRVHTADGHGRGS